MTRMSPLQIVQLKAYFDNGEDFGDAWHELLEKQKVSVDMQTEAAKLWDDWDEDITDEEEEDDDWGEDEEEDDAR